jgi:hypothetical protein
MNDDKDRLKDVKEKHYKQGGFDMGHDDVEWLINEVERLRKARILDHQHYMGLCSYMEISHEKYPDRSDVCRGIEGSISLYLRGLLRAYCGETHRFCVVDSGGRRP